MSRFSVIGRMRSRSRRRREAFSVMTRIRRRSYRFSVMTRTRRRSSQFSAINRIRRSRKIAAINRKRRSRANAPQEYEVLRDIVKESPPLKQNINDEDQRRINQFWRELEPLPPDVIKELTEQARADGAVPGMYILQTMIIVKHLEELDKAGLLEKLDDDMEAD